MFWNKVPPSNQSEGQTLAVVVWCDHGCKINMFDALVRIIDVKSNATALESQNWHVAALFNLKIYSTTCIVFCFEQEYTLYCRVYCSKMVSMSDKLEFVNGWYILIIISDTLTIIGSILKITIQTKVKSLLLAVNYYAFHWFYLHYNSSWSLKFARWAISSVQL